MSTLKSFLLGAGILAAGVVSFVALLALRPEPVREERATRAPLVATVHPELRSGHLTVQGSGTVRPTREVTLAAEVAGRIEWVSPSLVAGGRFSAGAALARVDQSDYVNAVTMAEAAVTQRKVEVLRAREEVAIAREEWERLRKRTGRAEPPPDTDLGSLVLREPQLRLAEAALKSAEAQLADARRRLERTRITAPFEGIVRAKRVDVGQYVAPGQAVATVHNTDEVEVVVPLASGDAGLVPDVWQAGRREPIQATVRAELGGASYTWDGYVDRVESLDPATRTLNLAVRVENPYRTVEDRPPLLVDAFTTVAIRGRSFDRYAVLPEASLRENDTIWVVEDGTLRVVPVEVIQERDGEVFVADPLAPDLDVITSNLTVVTDGMVVRASDGNRIEP